MIHTVHHTKLARIAQRSEHCPDMAKVEGSKPSAGIFWLGFTVGAVSIVAVLFVIFLSVWNVSH